MPEVRDPIHGFILFDDFERSIVDSEPVQRLKSVHQLALGYLVYPGATHSRFEHSLGTMELAGRAFDALVRHSSPDLISDVFGNDAERARWRVQLRLAGLLHDIGHGPFSHGGDQLFDPSVGSHEEMTRRLIQDRRVADRLTSQGTYRVDPDEVAFVASGDESSIPPSQAALVAKDLIAGELGVDRMDYLLRDSHMCGVNYGLFDLPRVVETMTLTQSPPLEDVKSQHEQIGRRESHGTAPTLAFQAGGLQAAEGLLLARYFMFSQVYFHKTRQAYDGHLERFLRRRLPGGRFPTDLDGYLALDDIAVLAMMRAHRSDRDAQAVLQRSHYRLVRELRSEDFEGREEVPAALAGRLASQFGQAAMVRNNKRGTVGLLPGDVLVVNAVDGSCHDILDRSPTIAGLRPVWVVQVLSEPSIRTHVLATIETVLDDLDTEKHGGHDAR